MITQLLTRAATPGSRLHSWWATAVIIGGTVDALGLIHLATR